MKILYLHGWASIPGGVKPTYLADAGHQVFQPPLDDNDFQKAMRSAQNVFDEENPDVVVGSSRGGAVAMNIDSAQKPLVLLCPAWKNWGAAASVKRNTVILHSRDDDIIPFEDSLELIEASGCGSETLLEIGEDHRLATPQPLQAMLDACERLVRPRREPT